MSDKIIRLGQQQELDLSSLGDEKAEQLQQKHAEAVIEMNATAQKVALDVKKLEKKLEVMNDAASTATLRGHSMKIDDKTTGEAGGAMTKSCGR